MQGGEREDRESLCRGKRDERIATTVPDLDLSFKDVGCETGVSEIWGDFDDLC